MAVNLVEREEEQEPRPQIDGITEEDWKAWRRSPTTKLLRRYLKDLANSVRGDIGEMVMRATVSPEEQARVRQHVADLDDIEALAFEQVLTFYEEKPEVRPSTDEDET